MTTLIKNADGQLLSAQGKLWDKSSVTECNNCPCYESMDPCEASDVKRVNLKASGKWGIEWTITHPGGTYTDSFPIGGGGPKTYTVDEYSESGSALVTYPELIASFDNTQSPPVAVIDNWQQINIELNNCAIHELGANNIKGNAKPIYTHNFTQSTSPYHLYIRQARVFDDAAVFVNNNPSIQYTNGDEWNRVIDTAVYLTDESDTFQTSYCSSSDCCNNGESSVNNQIWKGPLEDYLGRRIDGVFGGVSLPHVYDFSTTLTTHKPTFEIELIGA